VDYIIINEREDLSPYMNKNEDTSYKNYDYIYNNKNENMKIKDILKPKSPKQIFMDFCTAHQISEYQLKEFLKVTRGDKRIRVWIISIFLWVFGLSMIINSIMALDGEYFWFPIHQTKSMLAFINVFWVASWFAAAIFLIIYGIIILAKVYNDY
jgi:hypothetical protein